MTKLTGRRIGRYSVERLLGSGGMGAVYLARDTDLRRRVAIKCVAAEMESPASLRDRLLDEARSAARINHPGIAAVYDVLQYDGELLLVMEYVPGANLRSVIAGGADFVQRIDIARQCIEALAAAHEAGVVHRDLKPDNVMVRFDGSIKVLDFGLARLLPTIRSGAITEDGPSRTNSTLLGTPGYIAPEVMKGADSGVRADLFALGVLLYELFSGHHPFRSANVPETLRRVADEDPIRLDEIVDEVTSKQARIVHELLSKDPAGRPASARAVSALFVPGGTRSPARPRGFIAAAGGVAAVAAIAIAIWLGQLPGRHVGSGAELVLLPLENRTGDLQLDATGTVLREFLDQSGHYRLVSEEEILDGLARMRLDPSGSMDAATARELAWRRGAPLVITGALDRLGDAYVLTTRADYVGDTPLRTSRQTQQFRTDSREGLLEVIDGAGRWIRERAGEASTDLAQRSLGGAQLTSGSWRALELYVQHLQARRESRTDAAIALLKQALEIDPEFARAAASLGDIYNGRDQAIAHEYWLRAVELADGLRLSEKEELAIRAQYANDTGDYGRAVEAFRKFRQRFPHEFVANFGYGMALGDDGRVAEAIEAMETVARTFGSIDHELATGAPRYRHPGATEFTLINLLPYYLFEGNYEKSRVALDTVRQLRSEDASWVALVTEQRAILAYSQGDAEGALAILPENDGGIPPHRWSTIESVRAALLAEAGRPEEAARVLEAGIVHDENRDAPGAAADKEIALAFLAWQDGHSAQVSSWVERALSRSDDPYRLLRAGTLLARSGHVARARALLARLPATPEPVPAFEAPRLRILGEVELALGNVDAGLEALLGAHRLESPIEEREYLVHAFLANDDAAGAQERWRALTARGDRLAISRAWRRSPGFHRFLRTLLPSASPVVADPIRQPAPPLAPTQLLARRRPLSPSTSS